MRVFGYCTDPLPWTNPFPEADGFIFALRGGDLCSPDDWQNPTHVRRDYFRIPWRPFFSFRRGRFGFYVGWKVFGADVPDLKKFPSVNPSEVYDGSYAMQGFTWRFTTGL